MTNGEKTSLRIFSKSCIVIICAGLYALGGLTGYPLWLRRYLMPTILTLSMFYWSRDPKVFLNLPFMFGSLSLGYGADFTWLKILRRFSFGAANGLSFNIRNLINRNWLWSGFHACLVIGGCVALGVWNFTPNARTEEFIIGLLMAITLFNTKRPGEVDE